MPARNGSRLSRDRFPAPHSDRPARAPTNPAGDRERRALAVSRPAEHATSQQRARPHLSGRVAGRLRNPALASPARPVQRTAAKHRGTGQSTRQKISFNPSWISRGALAPVIVPNEEPESTFDPATSAAGVKVLSTSENWVW